MECSYLKLKSFHNPQLTSQFGYSSRTCNTPKNGNLFYSVFKSYNDSCLTNLFNTAFFVNAAGSKTGCIKMDSNDVLTNSI